MIGRIGLGLAGASLGTMAAAAAAQTAIAKPSALYVFGDSLSDRGNLADALGQHFPSPPFYHDSFINGDTAVQVLAQRLGLNADASLFPTAFQDVRGLGYTSGTNYVVAGATAGTLIPTGASPTQGVTGLNLGSQVAAFLAYGGETDGLTTVFIGGNDVRTTAHQGSTDPSGTFTYNPPDQNVNGTAPSLPIRSGASTPIASRRSPCPPHARLRADAEVTKRLVVLHLRASEHRDGSGLSASWQITRTSHARPPSGTSSS